MARYSIFWGRCNEQGHRFKLVARGPEGIRLLRSTQSNLPAKIDWQKDSMFDTVGKLVDAHFQGRGLSEATIADKFNKIFGLLCDPAPDGSLYDMTGKAVCPICQSKNVSYGPYDPNESVEMDVPDVTHKKWDAMTQAQRRQTIEMLLEEIKQ